MSCPRCQAGNPEVGHFCFVCGQDLRTDDISRKKSFAVKPDEPVASFNLVSTIMPRGVTQSPQTYKLALVIALVAALATAIFGALPMAVMIAAFAIPIVYIVYLYDVNQWEDEPVQVTALAFGLTFVLAIGWTLLALAMRGTSLPSGTLDTSGPTGPTFMGFLVAALLIPIVGELIRQIGPVVLAARPEFDDLMDGLTFGIISGVAYATADTLVRHWPLITGGFQGVNADAATWASLLFLEGFIKPLVLGTATGIACAEFSGLGKGYDGFTPRYFRGVAEAIIYNVLYFGGLYLFSFFGSPIVSLLVSILWGLAILAVLIIRVRNVLHFGLMEAALEHQARSDVGQEGDLQFCRSCEMPLLAGSQFCSACGTAVRVTQDHKQARTGIASAQKSRDRGASSATEEPSRSATALMTDPDAASEPRTATHYTPRDATTPADEAAATPPAEPSPMDVFFDDEEGRS